MVIKLGEDTIKKVRSGIPASRSSRVPLLSQHCNVPHQSQLLLLSSFDFFYLWWFSVHKNTEIVAIMPAVWPPPMTIDKMFHSSIVPQKTRDEVTLVKNAINHFISHQQTTILQKPAETRCWENLDIRMREVFTDSLWELLTTFLVISLLGHDNILPAYPAFNDFIIGSLNWFLWSSLAFCKNNSCLQFH